LLEVADARGPPGSLAGRLHGRQQHSDQHADDRDHDEEFDERETMYGATELESKHGKSCARGGSREEDESPRHRRDRIAF
jgi:hypothetical protein